MAELSRHQKRVIRQEATRIVAIGTRMGQEMADCLDDALRDIILAGVSSKGWPNRFVPAVKRIGVKTFTGLTILPRDTRYG